MQILVKYLYLLVVIKKKKITTEYFSYMYMYIYMDRKHTSLEILLPLLFMCVLIVHFVPKLQKGLPTTNALKNEHFAIFYLHMV